LYATQQQQAANVQQQNRQTPQAQPNGTTPNGSNPNAMKRVNDLTKLINFYSKY
jgi:hypothetical protein